MIESEVIVYSFIAAGILSLICFGIFILMNLKDRTNDEKMYKHRTDPRELVKKYRHQGKPLENEPNPIESLKKYAINEEKIGQEVQSSELEEVKVETEKKDETLDDTRFAPPDIKEALKNKKD